MDKHTKKFQIVEGRKEETKKERKKEGLDEEKKERK